jgi:hypothetical protein
VINTAGAFGAALVVVLGTWLQRRARAKAARAS